MYGQVGWSNRPTALACQAGERFQDCGGAAGRAAHAAAVRVGELVWASRLHPGGGRHKTTRTLHAGRVFLACACALLCWCPHLPFVCCCNHQTAGQPRQPGGMWGCGGFPHQGAGGTSIQSLLRCQGVCVRLRLDGWRQRCRRAPLVARQPCSSLRGTSPLGCTLPASMPTPAPGWFPHRAPPYCRRTYACSHTPAATWGHTGKWLHSTR